MTTGFQEDSSSVALKVLSSIKGLFETSTRRDAIVDRDPGTMDKVVLVELTAATLGTGHEPAAAMMDMVVAVTTSDPCSAVRSQVYRAPVNSPAPSNTLRSE